MVGYARPADYVLGTVAAALGPALFFVMEKIHPGGAGKGGFAHGMRLCTAVSLGGGFLIFYRQSASAFSLSSLLPHPRAPSTPSSRRAGPG